MNNQSTIDKSSPIAITGATGMQGAYLCRILLENGYRNLTALKRNSSSTELLGNHSSDIHWIEGDMKDLESLYELTRNKQVVFHCAAYVSLNPARKKEIFRVNINGTADLVNACLENGVKKLVHCSSVAAIGKPVNENNMADEEVEWNRTADAGIYAQSKYFSEMEVWRAHAEGLPVAIINPSIILGGGFWNKGSARLHMSMDKGVPFYPMGSGGFVDVRDVARMMIMLMHPKTDGQRYICSAENQSYQHVLSEIAQLMGKNPPSKPIQKWMIKALPPIMGLGRKLGLNTPKITGEMLRASSETIKYNNKKSRESLNFAYRPLQQTLNELTKVYLQSKVDDSKFGMLQSN